MALTLALTALLAIAGCRTTGVATPTTTPVAAAVASPGAVATGTAAGRATPAAVLTGLDAELDQIERRIRDLRGLRPAGETRRRFVDSATLARAISDELDRPESQEQIAREQKLYELLGLIERGDDLDGRYRSLLGSQVLGLYDPESEEFLVLEAGDHLSALAESTYAHEYVHRLQDVRFDLEVLTEAAEGNSDRQLALAALIEGDAVVTQLGYGFRFMNRTRLTELVRDSERLESPPADTPFVLLQGLQFPYTAGPLFIAALRGNQASFEAVDRAFAAPPGTSEQVMHPEKYRAGEGAASAEIREAVGVPEDGWMWGERDVLGEFMLKTWLTFLGRSDAARASAGWGGDAYRLLEGPGGASALVVRIVWDRPEEDAQEFFEAVVGGLDRSQGLRRVATSGQARVLWQGEGRAIGVQLGAAGTGTFMAAASEARLAEALLTSMAAP